MIVLLVIELHVFNASYTRVEVNLSLAIRLAPPGKVEPKSVVHVQSTLLLLALMHI